MRKNRIKVVIDETKWRCGGGSFASTKTGHGKGPTKLLNRQGYMCCLGFAALAADPTLTEKDILGIDTPANLVENVYKPIPALATHGHWSSGNTRFSDKAMAINDDLSISHEERKEKLIKLGQRFGIDFEFVNKEKK